MRVELRVKHQRKNSSPRMDPSETPLISVHDECGPFKTTLCFLLVKKSLKRYNKSQEKPYWYNFLDNFLMPSFIKGL